MTIRVLAAALVTCIPAVALAQSPRAATYITDEEVKLINASPGVDRQIVNVDIGIGDHVDYLSVRPDPDRVIPAPYVHPLIKK